MPSPDVPAPDSYQASLKRAVKHGLSPPQSPQLPAATGSGIHISQPRIFQPWWRGEAIKTSPGFFKSVSFFSFFFFFSVNSIHLGKGSKNTIVARRRDREGEKGRVLIYTRILFWIKQTLACSLVLKRALRNRAALRNVSIRQNSLGSSSLASSVSSGSVSSSAV